jgi:hypothetical protein
MLARGGVAVEVTFADASGNAKDIIGISAQPGASVQNSRRRWADENQKFTSELLGCCAYYVGSGFGLLVDAEPTFSATCRRVRY